MRYITQHSGLQLFKNDGTAQHRFNPQGILLVGSKTTAAGAGNFIVSATQTPDTGTLQRPWATDLDGNTTQTLEMAGLGTLTQVSKSGATLASLMTGYRGTFFEAPELTSTTSAVSATAGIHYIVISGTTIYNGTTYVAGEEFVTTGGITATTGTGKFALTIPPELKQDCSGNDNRFALFKERRLFRGDETQDWDVWRDGGFQPRSSGVCTSSDFQGYVI
jgi:hypothetical protein